MVFGRKKKEEPKSVGVEMLPGSDELKPPTNPETAGEKNTELDPFVKAFKQEYAGRINPEGLAQNSNLMTKSLELDLLWGICCELQSDIKECKQLIMEFDAKSFGRGSSPKGKP